MYINIRHLNGKMHLDEGYSCGFMINPFLVLFFFKSWTSGKSLGWRILKKNLVRDSILRHLDLLKCIFSPLLIATNKNIGKNT